MAPADYRGDIFYYPSSTWSVNHGHVGIYRWRKVIVESANKKLGVRKISIYDRRVPAGETYLFWVGPGSNGTQSQYEYWKSVWQGSANYSNTKVGADYRDWWSANRTTSAPYNCSQLVWAAYRTQASLDLDANGGDYVFPANIVNKKSWVHFYRLVA